MSETKGNNNAAESEIMSLSLNAKQYLGHLWRNSLQTITGHAQANDGTDVILPLPVRERFEAIQEEVQRTSENMRRIGI